MRPCRSPWTVAQCSVGVRKLLVYTQIFVANFVRLVSKSCSKKHSYTPWPAQSILVMQVYHVVFSFVGDVMGCDPALHSCQHVTLWTNESLRILMSHDLMAFVKTSMSKASVPILNGIQLIGVPFLLPFSKFQESKNNDNHRSDEASHSFIENMCRCWNLNKFIIGAVTLRGLNVR